MEVQIYTNKPGPRLQYVCGFIFRDVLSMEYRIIREKQELKSNGLVLNYSEKDISEGLWIFPSGLLEKENIEKVEIKYITEEEMTCLFPVEKGDLIFDPLSAIFYLISRYEEYLPSEKDRYGRFQARKSIAQKCDFLDKPVVNQWILLIYQKLKEKFPTLKDWEPVSFFKPTIDIDNPWAFRNKPVLRIIAGMMKDTVFMKWSDLKFRMKVLSGNIIDPYDSFEYILQNHPPDLKIFFLVGNRDRRDSKFSINKSEWRELIYSLSQNYEPGLHPSYSSKSDRGKLSGEKQILEKITETTISISRQHFLKLNIPKTYRALLSVGISADYSMGYAELPGFRAGTSVPFYFYDLEKEKETVLRIFPFVVMDRTLKDYMGLTPEEAIQVITKLMTSIHDFGGNFISVWHNESLGSSNEWKGWTAVYDHILKEAGRLL